MDYDRQVAKLKKRIASLEQELQIDELTQILSRRGLMASFRPVFDAVAFEQKNPRKRRNLVINSLSIIFVDIDNFKKVNDTFGHAAGDEALKKVAEILRDGTRGMDIVGRYGGEEMILGLLGADKHDAVKTAEALREKIEQTTVVLDHATLKLTASFGVAELTSEKNIDELLHKADKALYQAKESGRNQVAVAK